jgi:hypothetical protein
LNEGDAIGMFQMENERLHQLVENAEPTPLWAAELAVNAALLGCLLTIKTPTGSRRRDRDGVGVRPSWSGGARQHFKTKTVLSVNTYEAEPLRLP